MGRPLRKDVNGVDVIRSFGTNTPGDENAGIRLEGYFGGALATDYMIIKQRGAKTFVVLSESDDSFVDGESIKGPDSADFKTGTLVATEPNANGEIRMLGYDSGGANPVAIAKITKRVATDFSGNKYTWAMSNYDDSTGDHIVLTAI
jgi:hypothetical protein